MKRSEVPAGFSGVHTRNVAGNTIEFCVMSDAAGHAVNITQNQQGVQLKVTECEFFAIVEFNSPWFKSSGIYNPQSWHVGFVQNMTDGAIIFEYGAGNDLVYASIAPENLPCKDAGSIATWYDPSPLSLKRLGINDEMADMIPNTVGQTHPCRTKTNVRFVQMGDAPGTGALPLRVPCKATRDQRAQINTDYTVGWFDPLNTNAQDPQRRPLKSISGHLTFRTYLAMSSEASMQNLRVTTNFNYLYFWEWTVDYSTTVNQGVAARGGNSGATLVNHGVVQDNEVNPIVNGADANESVCVKFL